MTKEVISIFYSTTEEPYINKYKKIFGAVASEVEEILNVRFDIMYWKQMPRGLGSSGQSVIDEHVKGKYQIYVGIMGTKFGKGTEHEYRTAVKACLDTGHPNEVFFYFCEEPINPYDVDLASFKGVKKFRKDIADPDVYNAANFYAAFSDEAEFRQNTRVNLRKAVENILGRTKGGYKV